jgi:hypothetical protein
VLSLTDSASLSADLLRIHCAGEINQRTAASVIAAGNDVLSGIPQSSSSINPAPASVRDVDPARLFS